ncbi:hypothetical protein VDGL01_05903 [Verticillium dahliae]
MPFAVRLPPSAFRGAQMGVVAPIAPGCLHVFPLPRKKEPLYVPAPWQPRLLVGCIPSHLPAAWRGKSWQSCWRMTFSPTFLDMQCCHAAMLTLVPNNKILGDLTFVGIQCAYQAYEFAVCDDTSPKSRAKAADHLSARLLRTTLPCSHRYQSSRRSTQLASQLSEPAVEVLQATTLKKNLIWTPYNSTLAAHLRCANADSDDIPPRCRP